MKLHRRLIRALMVATLASCGSDPEPPTGPPSMMGPGFVYLRLATPNTDDGALYLTLGGAPFDSVTSVYTTLAASSGPNEQQMVLAGEIREGVVMIFWVPERRDLALYSVNLQQVAARTTYQQRGLAGYSLTITP